MVKRRIKKRPVVRAKAQKHSFFERDYGRLPQLLLGATLAIILILIGVLYVRQGAWTPTNQPDITITRGTDSKASKPAVTGQTYTVQTGDTLWSIAEEAYGSGFNAHDISEANKLTNPGAIEIGQRLMIPSVEARDPTRGEVASGTFTTAPTPTSLPQPSQNRSGDYVVVQGDYLWKIAETQLGNPYRWVEIARLNNLANPDLIYPGNRFTLPSR